MESLLLHICCGPCSIVPLRLLSEKGDRFAACFYNPNITSRKEHDLRAETFRSFAVSLGLELVLPPYEIEEWSAAIAPFAGVFPLIAGSTEYDENSVRREQRCRICYRLRFERLASEAQVRGYESISTTLSISPYQFTDCIEEELTGAALSHSVVPAFVDYRPYYPESIERSCGLGMYRQNFCGCRYSKEEADMERLARKSHKKLQLEMVQDATHG